MSRHVLVIGDVGARTVLHAGDEAMLDGALTEVGSRQDVRWTVVSGAPTETAARYDVAALSGLGFDACADDDQREARLAEVLSAVRGDLVLPAGDPAVALLDAIAGSDAVLVAGGGNLAAAWPHHVYERAALAAAAAAAGIPLVVSGQGIGPQLTSRLGELVNATLTGARFVGVRESRSADTARRLGVAEERIWCAPDDAAFLRDEPTDLAALGVSSGQFVAVTFSDYGGFLPAEELTDRLARVLDTLADQTGLDVLLLPHLSAVDAVAHDELFSQVLVQAAKSDRVRAAGPLQPRELAWLCGQAALVVSNRYHPIVFAVHRGVPAVGLCVDDYTEQKICGSMELMGVASWALSVSAPMEVITEAISECWERRDELAQDLALRAERQAELKTRYWDALCEALAGDLPRAALPGAAAGVTTALGGWAQRNDDAVRALLGFSRHAADLQRQRDEAIARLARADRELLRVRADHHDLYDRLGAVSVELTVEQAAGDVARAERAREMEQAAADRERLRWASAELAALHRTKLMRWTKAARAAYGELRARKP